MCVHLAEGAGADGEILAERGDGNTPDVARADDDAVGWQVFFIHPEMVRLVVHMGAHLLECVRLEQGQEALPGRQQTLFMALADLFLAARREDFLAACLEFRDEFFW